MKSPRIPVLRTLYYLGLAEGTSFLVLLLIAMPLKYLAGQPAAVGIVGRVHGGLFVLYVAAVLLAALLSKWKLTRVALGLISSVVPLGPFFFDASVKREIAEIAPINR